MRLAAFSGAATPSEMRALCDEVFVIAAAPRIGLLLPVPSAVSDANRRARGDRRQQPRLRPRA